MECKKAYDLDGVLAEKPPLSEKSWGKMKGHEREARKAFLVQFYRNAKPLIPWDGESIVITARKDEPTVRIATMEWFMQHYGKMPKICFLEASRSTKNVIAFKSFFLSHYKIQEFYEDNKKVLEGVKESYPSCTYYFVRKDLKILKIEPF